MQLFNVEAIVFTKQNFFLTPKAWKNRPHNRPNFFLRTGLAAKTARTTKNPLMQEWVFRLGP